MRPRSNGLWPASKRDMTLAGVGLYLALRCMTVKAFVDTNILVYAHDRLRSGVAPPPQAFLIVKPPSTGNATPVMKPAAGSTRLSVPCATSSGSA